MRESVWAWSSSAARTCALSSASAAASPKRFASSNSSVGEARAGAEAVDVERALDGAAGDERDGDEGLGLVRRARHGLHARVEVRVVHELRLAVVDRPARDPLAEDRLGRS